MRSGDSLQEDVWTDFWLMTIISFFLFLLSAFYFYLSESNWNFLESMYFVLISMSTVGFGKL